MTFRNNFTRDPKSTKEEEIQTSPLFFEQHKSNSLERVISAPTRCHACRKDGRDGLPQVTERLLLLLSRVGGGAIYIFQQADQMCSSNHIHRTIITESET